MKIVVRKAEKEDMGAVLELINELAHFEKEAAAAELTVADLVRDGYGVEKLFHCFVATKEKHIIGLALVYPRYSTWKGAVLHLEDLIVTKKLRGTGAGTALLNAVVRYGSELGVKRISWDVLDWNEDAIKFYESKGAKVMRDWDLVQLNSEGITKYLENI